MNRFCREQDLLARPLIGANVILPSKCGGPSPLIRYCFTVKEIAGGVNTKNTVVQWFAVFCPGGGKRHPPPLCISGGGFCHTYSKPNLTAGYVQKQNKIKCNWKKINFHQSFTHFKILLERCLNVE